MVIIDLLLSIVPEALLALLVFILGLLTYAIRTFASRIYEKLDLLQYDIQQDTNNLTRIIEKYNSLEDHVQRNTEDIKEIKKRLKK